MIYICIPSYNEAPTIGLLLWKIRQVFAGFPREYHLLVLDDGSSDSTAEVLERYTRVLPLTVTRHQSRLGYAESVEEILRQAVQRTDRPKRDAAILMHADFTHNPQFIPDLVRRIESGADIVIGQAKVQGERSRARRLVRRLRRCCCGGSFRFQVFPTWCPGLPSSGWSHFATPSGVGPRRFCGPRDGQPMQSSMDAPRSLPAGSRPWLPWSVMTCGSDPVVREPGSPR